MDEVANGFHHMDVLVVKFNNPMQAILAKRRGNHDSFYGRKLYIQYAPDFETVDEFREKMSWRAKRVDDAVCNKKDSKIIESASIVEKE